MEGLSRKVASNDKIQENISNKMDSFASAIKNQHSFNKMIESQCNWKFSFKNHILQSPGHP